MSERNRRWSPYGYGNANPVRFTDPDGQMTADEVMAWYRRQELTNFGNSSSGALGQSSAAETNAALSTSAGQNGTQIDEQQTPRSDVSTSENENNDGEAVVYIETDGIGHVYIEVNGTIFSYGRYNGSYSPASGRFGPVGDGVLLKKEGAAAKDFIKERTSKFPTKSYKIGVNVANTYSYLNNIYNAGKLTKVGAGAAGKIVNTYMLIGSNCSTFVCGGLNAGGANIGIYETPSSLNYYLKNIENIRNGYNPALWGPKQ